MYKSTPSVTGKVRLYIDRFLLPMKKKNESDDNNISKSPCNIPNAFYFIPVLFSTNQEELILKSSSNAF